MINFDDVVKENIPDHLHRTIIIGGSGSAKTNSLFNLINSNPILIKSIYI